MKIKKYDFLCTCMLIYIAVALQISALILLVGWVIGWLCCVLCVVWTASVSLYLQFPAVSMVHSDWAAHTCCFINVIRSEPVQIKPPYLLLKCLYNWLLCAEFPVKPLESWVLKMTPQEMSSSCFQFLWPKGFRLQFYLRDPSLVRRGGNDRNRHTNYQPLMIFDSV